MVHQTKLGLDSCLKRGNKASTVAKLGPQCSNCDAYTYGVSSCINKEISGDGGASIRPNHDWTPFSYRNLNIPHSYNQFDIIPQAEGPTEVGLFAHADRYLRKLCGADRVAGADGLTCTGLPSNG